ncbi:response regulator [Methylocystis sp. MitZ-2018]|nr:response regulator [Methylocystis sp. MitZ-2018]
MGIDDTVAIMEALSKLLSVVIWPAIIIYALIKYGATLREFFATLNEFTLKGAGFEASFETKRAKDQASKALVAAAVTRQEADLAPAAVAKNVLAANNAVEAVTAKTIRRVSGAQILWVDDRPENNMNERRALEALGIHFVISKSTDDALSKIREEKFDVIISDMGRPPDFKAGYTLLAKLKDLRVTVPYIIYAGSRDAEHVAESRKRGALGCTNRPDELFEYVLSALLAESPPLPVR